MTFRASYDRTARIVSAATAVLLCIITIVTHSVFAGALAALIMAAAYAWSPTGYSVADGSVVIRRIIGDVRIPIGGIRDVRVATADDFSGCIRIFGSGGLFGYFGLYRTSRLGRSTWYVTNRSHSVIIAGDSGTAVLSPDDVESFKAAVSRTAPSGTIADSGGGGNVRKACALIAVASVLAWSGVMAGSLFYSPGLPAYTLTGESLTIHDRFYPVTLDAASVDIGNVRVVDFNRDADWKPTERTNGFGSLHYHSGWFRVLSGNLVRMYRADGTRVVLLPPRGGGATVLLEVREPEKFLAEVREKWTRGS